MLNKNKVMHKTRLTQNKKAKHTSNANTKHKKGRERRSDRIIWNPFPSTPWKIFPFSKPLIWG